VGPCAGKGSRGGQVAVSKLVLSIEQSAVLIEAVLSDVLSALNACRAISGIFVVTLQGRGTVGDYRVNRHAENNARANRWDPRDICTWA
jgi:hypothetical protein